VILYDKTIGAKNIFFHGWILCFIFLSSEAHNKIVFIFIKKLYVMYFISYIQMIYYKLFIIISIFKNIEFYFIFYKHFLTYY